MKPEKARNYDDDDAAPPGYTARPNSAEFRHGKLFGFAPMCI